MQSNQSNAPIGVNQTTGNVQTYPYITVLSNRNPTQYDYNYPIKQRWVNTIELIEWILVSFTNISGTSLAVWQQISSSADNLTLTGNTGGAVEPDGSNNINIVGDGTTIQITGNPGTHTLTASLIGTPGEPAIEKVTVQAGTTTILPVNGNINVSGRAVTNSGIPVQTFGVGSNTLYTQVQFASQQASSSASFPGLASFNSAQFTVDNNGWASLSTSYFLRGTFTPTLSFGGSSTGITYSTQTGNYQIVGSLLYFNTSIVLTSKGSQSGNAALNGLPYSSFSGDINDVYLNIDHFNIPVNAYNILGIIQPSSTSITFNSFSNASPNTSSQLTDTSFNNNTSLRFWGFYFIS